MKTLPIGQLFSDDELARGRRIYFQHKGEPSFEVMKAALRDQIVIPAMPRINQVTGQENDPDYMAYALIYAYQQNEAD